MDNLRYYFFEGKVETATTTIHGWQELSLKQIEKHLSGGYDVAFVNDKWDLVLHVDQPFDLDFYKESKISEMSLLSLEVGETLAPDYKLRNCLLSKEMELNGETPIYLNWRDVMDDYKNKRVYLRNEFYKLKGLIWSANNKDEIDTIVSTNKYYDYEKNA